MDPESKFECLLTANDLQGWCGRLHDEVFHTSFWRSLPIPGVFRPINFAKHTLELPFRVVRLRHVCEQYNSLEQDDIPIDWDDVDRVFNTLCSKLEEAIKSLYTICSNLYEKAYNDIPYSMATYKVDVQGLSQRPIVDEPPRQVFQAHARTRIVPLTAFRGGSSS